MAPDQSQQPQGSQKGKDKAPAAHDQKQQNMPKSSVLNPNSVPWTPSPIPGGITNIAEQTHPVFHNPSTHHSEVNISSPSNLKPPPLAPQLTSQALQQALQQAQSTSLLPVEPRHGTEAQNTTNSVWQVNQEHAPLQKTRLQEESEQVEPLYRSIYDPNGRVLPQENPLGTAGPSANHNQIPIVGLNGLSGFPPLIRQPVQVPGMLNQQFQPPAYGGFVPGVTGPYGGHPGFIGPGLQSHPAGSLDYTSHRIGFPSLTPAMPIQGPTTQNQTVNVALPGPHSLTKPAQTGSLAASRSTSMVDLDLTPTPIRSHPVQIPPSSDGVSVISNRMGTGLNDPATNSSQVAQSTEPRNFAPKTAGMPVTFGPPPKFNIGSLNATSPMRSVTVNDDPFPSPKTGTSVILAAPTESHPANLAPMPPQPVPDAIRHQRSVALNNLTGTWSGLPSATTALASENFPFVVTTEQSRAANHGVIKLQNIPFITTRSEVIAFLGRNSKILNDTDEPVHIIMDRVSSKTNDAYVEFQSMDDAVATVDRFLLNFSKGKVNRLGDRPVGIELSSQGALMKDLFPFATGLRWTGTQPHILGPRMDGVNYGNFRGFVTEEEMVMLVKHVEMPNRSPFAKECPQRAFESLISTLKKLPWDFHDYITVRQRAAIHRATVDLVRILFFKVRDHADEVNLTSQLLKRLVSCAMKCPGFTPVQKDDIAYLVGMDPMQCRAHGQPRFADSWCHLYALSPKPSMPLDVLEWYIALIREETNRTAAALPMGRRAELERLAGDTDGYFGYLWAELPRPFGVEADRMTLGACARAEIAAIERIIRRALGN